jgi:carbonic anhydrase
VPASKSPLENYGYSGNLAPWYWANLNDKWKNCASKVNQSPIDLSGAKLDEKLKTLKFFYQHGITTIYFEHQTVKGKVERGSYLEWDGERFDLETVYFRTPSEHRVNSLPFELEAQLEHTAVDGRKLMVSTLFTPGKSNDLMERVAKNIPTLPDDTRDIDRANWIDLFPLKKTYWTYVGSSTTPPCSPDVRWIVFTQESYTNKSSIDHFGLRQKANARPVYTLGERRLVRSNR